MAESVYKAEDIFNDVHVERFPRYLFNKSYLNSFTCNHGLAIPAFVDEVLPGQRLNELQSFGRIQLQPLATASMQNIRAYMRYFYVPYRLLWDKWDEFISQDAFVDTPLLAPQYYLYANRINEIAKRVGGLSDMLGVGVTNLDHNGSILEYNNDTYLTLSCFRYLAYWLIWDRYFRDENLMSTPSTLNIDLLPGPNNQFLPQMDYLLPVCWEKDYFTTALPWTQKGEPVNLSAYVSAYSLNGSGTVTSNGRVQFYDSINNDILSLYLGRASSGDGSVPAVLYGDTGDNYDGVRPHNLLAQTILGQTVNTVSNIPPSTLSTSVNINDLRYSNALQRYLERLAIGGNRPAEFYLSMYGVKIDDLRIGDPLYLGGGYEYISISPVVQQSETASTPQGTLAGNGTARPTFTINEDYYCQEPGIVMGIFYLRPEINYTQGIPKEFSLSSHYDYPNPIFGHLGEEPVFKSELFVKDGLNNSNTEDNNDDIFGYQSRYAYKKHKRNEVHGELKTSLHNWLLSNNFDSSVELNDDFVTVAQNYDIFAVQSADIAHHYIVELYHYYKTEMSLPDFSIPSL